MDARTFVLGDVHGNFKALKQVIEKCGIDKENDLLITLGDITDGFPDVYNCVEELLTIKNRIDIRGNHDDWFLTWLQTGIHPDQWRQGGHATYDSYVEHLGFELMNPMDIPDAHRNFFYNQKLVHKDEDKNVFVHGGFYRNEPLFKQDKYTYLWDRDLTEDALSCHKGDKLKYVEDVNEVFIGHTPVPYIIRGQTEPIHAQNVWNLDTGAGGRRGRLTIMQLDTHEFWQSDVGKELYPDGGGRNF